MVFFKLIWTTVTIMHNINVIANVNYGSSQLNKSVTVRPSLETQVKEVSKKQENNWEKNPQINFANGFP